jgi:hypothetical protein
MTGPKLDASQAGRALVAGDVAIGAGWGTVATKAIRSGSNDARGAITVLATTTGLDVTTSTVTVTFAKAKSIIPVVKVSRDNGDEAAVPDTITKGFLVVSTSKTGFVVAATTVAADTKKNGFSYIVVE